MDQIRLGRTGLMVSASSFGALPIQRVDMEEAVRILRKAYENGINFFDTANMYTDSEEKIGRALSDVRGQIVIATKSGATTKEGVLEHAALSLKRLKTDYVDLLQLHNPTELPDPDDPDGSYAGLVEAQKRGWTRFIGMTNHGASRGREAVLSGKYDTLQFPFSSLATPEEIELAELAQKHDVGFIAMKGLAGGLLTHVRTTFCFIKQYPYVVPIWGIQRESELDEFLQLEKQPPVYDGAMKKAIEQEREELMGEFCHGCGYCLPCPALIEIPVNARMSLLMRRMPLQRYMDEETKAKMLRIRECVQCGNCTSKCPYHLDPPRLLRENLEHYLRVYEEFHKVQT